MLLWFLGVFVTYLWPFPQSSAGQAPAPQDDRLSLVFNVQHIQSRHEYQELVPGHAGSGFSCSHGHQRQWWAGMLKLFLLYKLVFSCSCIYIIYQYLYQFMYQLFWFTQVCCFCSCLEHLLQNHLRSAMASMAPERRSSSPSAQTLRWEYIRNTGRALMDRYAKIYGKYLHCKYLL